MKMEWLGKTKELLDALRVQEARIAALEERSARLDSALREMSGWADNHAGKLGDVTDEMRRLADRVATVLDAVPADIEGQRGALIGLRNDLVKLRVEVDHRAVEADTQTRALLSRIEATRQR